MATKARKNNNYCTNCGYLAESPIMHKNCPVCGTDRKCFSTYDMKLDTWVRRSVEDNLRYPDIQGTNWGHENSSLSRHIRSAVFNAVNNYKSRK